MFGIPIPFTVLKGHDYVEGLLERDELVNVQLPQKFDRAKLTAAHEAARRDGTSFTEDASLFFRYAGERVRILPGSDRNIKITRPDRHRDGRGDLRRRHRSRRLTMGKVVRDHRRQPGHRSRRGDPDEPRAGRRAASCSSPAARRASRRRPPRSSAAASRSSCIPYDLADLDGIPGLVRGIHDRFGSIDVLLNIAGYAEPQSLLDTTTDNLVTTFTINVFAMLVLIREIVPLHASTGRPRSSTSPRRRASPRAPAGWPMPRPRRPSCRCRRRSPTSWPAAGIKVYSISPGRTATELRRKLAPEEDPTKIMQPSHVADVIAHAHARRRADAGRPEHHRPPAAPDGRMSRLEYLLAGAILRVVGLVFSHLRVRRDRVVLATARVPTLDGNLLHLRRAMLAAHPELDYRRPRRAVQLRPGRQARATSSGSCAACTTCRPPRLFVVDNAYLPIHVAPHRAATTVVQVWHAAGALKRFGLDAGHAAGRAGTDVPASLLRLGRRAAANAPARPYAAALRTPGRAGPRRSARRARTSSSTPTRWPPRATGSWPRHPALAGRRVVVYAPTFRGRGIGKRAAPGLDAVAAPGRAAGRRRRSSSRPTRTSTRRRPRPPASTSSSTRRPRSTTCSPRPTSSSPTTRRRSSSSRCCAARSCCSCGDLAEYELDPGLYLDYRTEMIGTQVVDTAGIVDAIATRAVRPVGLRRLHRAPPRGIAGRRQRALRRATSWRDGPGVARAR